MKRIILHFSKQIFACVYVETILFQGEKNIIIFKFPLTVECSPGSAPPPQSMGIMFKKAQSCIYQHCNYRMILLLSLGLFQTFWIILTSTALVIQLWRICNKSLMSYLLLECLQPLF